MLGALISGGLGLAGALMGSQPQTKTTAPWKGQQPYLKDVFSNAQGLYNNQGGPYSGNYYAGMTGMTDQALQGIGGFSPYAQNVAQGAMGAGAGLFGAGDAAAGYAGSLGAMGMQDPTQQHINNAGQYADNPYMQGMVNAANRDTARNLYENELPGANRMNSMTGNQNSSRAGMREAMLTRAADDRMADTSAAMRGSAWSQGLGASQADRGQNMNALGVAGSQMGGLFNSGINAANMGQNNAFNALDAQAKAGQAYQQNNQGYLDDAFKQWQMQDQYGWGQLANYQSMINGNYGQTQTSGGGAAGAMQGGLGGAVTGLGLYNQYKYPQGKGD